MMNLENPNHSDSDDDEELDCSDISDSGEEEEDVDWLAMYGQEGAEKVDWVAIYGREVAEEDLPAINADYGLHFRPSPRVLIRKFLRVKISGKLHRMPPHIRCNVVNLSAPDFSSVDYNPHLNLNYYFCVRSEAVSASDWRMVSGPILVKCRDGSVCGSFSEYHLMNTDVRVKEYRSVELDQLEEEEICVYEVLPRKLSKL